MVGPLVPVVAALGRRLIVLLKLLALLTVAPLSGLRGLLVALEPGLLLGVLSVLLLPALLVLPALVLLIHQVVCLLVAALSLLTMLGALLLWIHEGVCLLLSTLVLLAASVTLLGLTVMLLLATLLGAMSPDLCEPATLLALVERTALLLLFLIVERLSSSLLCGLLIVEGVSPSLLRGLLIVKGLSPSLLCGLLIVERLPLLLVSAPSSPLLLTLVVRLVCVVVHNNRGQSWSLAGGSGGPTGSARQSVRRTRD